jgi:hypothetical protein
MRRTYRLAVTAVSAVIVAALTTAVAFGAGYLGPGHYVSTFADASGAWFSSGFVSVSVDRNNFVFRGHDGTSYMQEATILIFSVKTNTVLGEECFVIPDKDFVQSDGVQLASLNTTASSLCPGFATPLASVVGLSGGKGGGPGPGGNIVLPVTFNVNWQGNGTTATSINTGRFSCGGFSSENEGQMSSASGAATGTITFGDGTVLPLGDSAQASVDSGSDTSDMQGYPSIQCFGK